MYFKGEGSFTSSGTQWVKQFIYFHEGPKESGRCQVSHSAPFAVGERRRRRCTISIQTIMMTGFRMDGRLLRQCRVRQTERNGGAVTLGAL